jgi:GPH family glycoside/pentoside/hexuronide:cation symporter
MYSLGGLAMNMSNLVLSQWLYERYVEGHILGAGLFSLILLAGRCTDGISDPFIAFWTDNGWTRWGRRLPFLVLATLPFAVFAFLLWTPPAGDNELIRQIYTVVVTQGYFLGYGLVVTTYMGLLPEIAGLSQ